MKIWTFLGDHMFVYFQLIVYKTQTCRLEASYAENAQSKNVWNVNLDNLIM